MVVVFVVAAMAVVGVVKKVVNEGTVAAMTTVAIVVTIQ